MQVIFKSMQQEQKDVFRLGYKEIKKTLDLVLRKNGFTEEKADLCSTLFTETSLDGVYSHGLNRFPLFIEYVRRGYVKPEMEPSLIHSLQSFEKWDGNLGPGNLNATFCMDRAIQLARSTGTGIVSLRNTNHWLRGGSYGIQAAKQNCIGLCMTNTMPNMTPWGGQEPMIGNNPFIVSVPYEPYPILLDMAMSQYSYGKMQILKQEGKKLPSAGGFDKNLKLTDDPSEILETMLGLPIGYWKGSGMAIMIDLLVSLFSDGLTTFEIGNLGDERSLSQLFMAFDLDRISEVSARERIIHSIMGSLSDCDPIEKEGKVYYPGEQTWLRRKENEKSGIPVNPDTWKRIKELLS
ncbi:3-dehydro-L-gulonate 2-dehydrogenase [Bacteroidota bacterium]